MPAWHRAVPLSERADCGGVPACLALAGGQPVAVADACAHRGTALSGGLVRHGVLTCPGHFWRYDLRTGRCLHSQDAVPAYPCRVVAGWVEVLLPDPEPVLPMRQWLLAAAHLTRPRANESVKNETPPAAMKDTHDRPACCAELRWRHRPRSG